MNKSINSKDRNIVNPKTGLAEDISPTSLYFQCGTVPVPPLIPILKGDRVVFGPHKCFEVKFKSIQPDESDWRDKKRRLTTSSSSREAYLTVKDYHPGVYMNRARAISTDDKVSEWSEPSAKFAVE